MRKLLEKFRRDSWGMGIFLGAVVPALTFGILYGLIALILVLAGKNPTETLNINVCEKLMLLSVVPSVFIMRYYLLKLKYDYTGRGILLVTFIFALAFVVLTFLA